MVRGTAQLLTYEQAWQQQRSGVVTHQLLNLQLVVWWQNVKFILTLALARGGVDATPPEGFLRCTPNYEADRAEILHSLWGILCATFGKTFLTESCQVTEL